MPAQGGPHFFPHATNPVINGGAFTSITNQTNSKVNGLQLLLENVSRGALYNSAERGDPPRCHERTRIAIRKHIMEWIKAPSSMRKLILWMYGPAGAGKTAIAQSIAEECRRLGLLAASFFFWRTAAGRNDTSRFIATIAYQLSRYIPHMENHLITAIENDPLIFSSSLSDQMRILVIEPLKLAAPSLSTPMVAIVDGVDECGPNGKSQAELLRILGSIASELSHLPLVFLVSSRPELEFRKAFNGSYLSPLTKALVLDNTYKPDEDIKVYFDSKFREIYDEDIRELVCRLPSPWPTPSDVDFLVSKASGQFIFASTVIKFVGSDPPRSNPADRLDIVLRRLHLRSTENETPFAPLDELYRFILGSVRELDKVLEVFTLLLCDGRVALNFNVAEELLGFDIRRALIDMHALLSVPPPGRDDLPTFHHASLSDFLKDRSRSSPEYYIDETQGRVNLCRHWLRLLGSGGSSRYGYNRPISEFLHHSYKLHSPIDQEVVEELACFDLRAVLERISDFEEDLHGAMWNSFMECAKKMGQGREDVFPRLQKEFNAFILDRIDQYPPSLKQYVPAVLHSVEDRENVFNILLQYVSRSAKELNELRELDRKLLHLSTPNSPYLLDEDNCHLFKVAVKAGQHVADSYAALAKAVINVIWPSPGERNQQITPEDRAKELNLVNFYFLETLLEEASIDLDLACLLYERVVQFKSDAEPMLRWDEVVKASIEYIERCEETTSNSDDTSDSESESDRESVAPSAHQEVLGTPIPSSLRLPPISEWYQVTTIDPTVSTRSTTPPLIRYDVLDSQTASSSRLPSISEWYQCADTLTVPQSKRKRVDTLTSPLSTNESDTDKRRKV